MPGTEKGNSPPSVDGSSKSPVIRCHPSSPIFPRVVGARSPDPSIRSISTESNESSDGIEPIKSCSTPLDSASSPGITMPRRVQHARTSSYQGIPTRDVMVSQEAQLRQPFTPQSSAPVGRTAVVDITDSWLRRYIATSALLSAPTNGSLPTHPASPATTLHHLI